MELQAIYRENILGKEMVVYGDKENPLFLAKDVAEWIGYTGRTGQMLSVVEEEEKLTNKIYSSGQYRNMWFLTEDGIYEVLMNSSKPIAKSFKKEVKRILKEIRTKGVSATDDYIEKALQDPDFAIRTLTALKMEREARIEAQNKLSEAAPKIEFAEALERSNDSISVGEMAKLISDNGFKIGQNKLFSWLLENKYVMRSSTKHLIPTQRSIDYDWLETLERSYVEKATGNVKITLKTIVTSKGQKHLLRKFKNKEVLVIE